MSDHLAVLQDGKHWASSLSHLPMAMSSERAGFVLGGGARAHTHNQHATKPLGPLD